MKNLDVFLDMKTPLSPAEVGRLFIEFVQSNKTLQATMTTISVQEGMHVTYAQRIMTEWDETRVATVQE